jgi:uncharacterized protein (DUF983 family)
MLKIIIENYKSALALHFERSADKPKTSLFIYIISLSLGFIFCAFVLFKIDSWAVGSENVFVVILKMSAMLTIVAMPFLYGYLISLTVSVWSDIKRKRVQ